VRPLADPQRGLGQVVEHPAGGALGLPGGQRPAQLAEHLGLADHHRVQAAGDVEQVLHGPVVVVHVVVLGQLLGRDPGVLADQLGKVGQRAVEAADVGVDLQPVAGRHRYRLGDVLGADGVADQLRHPVRGERDLLQQRDGRGAVGQADHEQAHAGLTSSYP
jgi:hypothetical protein